MKKILYSPFSLAVLLVFLGSAVCSGCYTLKQGTTMLGYLNRAMPLEDLAARDSADAEENRRFVMQVMEIRRFAAEELGLKESKNYTRYVELDRNYLAAVVSASAKDSFTRFQWWFPVVGKVPYKGFFDLEDALKERGELESKKDLDVWIRGVDAFSTLGWFRDPLYSYMKNYSLQDLAELIIHEQLHATVYIKSNSQFNEELAEFVGTEGARLYMERNNSAETRGANSLENEEDAKADNAVYLGFIRGLIADLDQVYKNQNLSREEKLVQKAEIIARSKDSLEENYDTLFRTDNYHFFYTLPVNNAYLELFRLYYQENTWYKDLYERSGKDLKAFVAAAKTVKGKKDPRSELEKALIK